MTKETRHNSWNTLKYYVIDANKTENSQPENLKRSTLLNHFYRVALTTLDDSNYRHHFKPEKPYIEKVNILVQNDGNGKNGNSCVPY